MWKTVINSTRLRSIANKRWSHQPKVGAGQSYLHNPGSEPLVYDTLGEVIEQTVNKYPDRVAIRSLHENITITYAELLKQADSLGCALRAQGLQKGDTVGVWSHNSTAFIVAVVAAARAGLISADSLGCALRAQGLQKGDTVGVWSHNSTAFIVAVVAAARAGLISVLINPIYEKKELSFCIKKTGMKSLLIGDALPKRNYYDSLSQLIPELQNHAPGAWKSSDFPTLNSIINTGKDKLAGTIQYDSLVTGSGSQISQYGGEVKSSDGSIIHFTSGTTGDPKAALDSHLGVVNNTYFIGKRNTLDEGHNNICVQVPLFHALGSVVTILGGLRHGSSLVLAGPIYNVDDNIKALFAEKCSVIMGTPTMFVDMLAKIRTMGDVPSRLRVALAAGAPCSPQLIRDMQKYLKAETVKGLYGMTETTACVFQSVPGDSIDVVAETVGYIQDHVEVKVVDEKGNSVPFGSPGELVVRGYNIMIGYWDDPVKTKQALSEDGWLKTGDKFTISEDGYGRIVGRLKDIIVRGGENIAPKEIEDLLITHPDIDDCQVIGIPDGRLGEELCAVLRVREGASVTVDEVRRHCDGRLARFKIPRVLKTIEEFPKTASGKIQKYRLKEMIEAGEL